MSTGNFDSWLILTVAAIVLIPAVVTDVRHHRIPNLLAAVGFSAGILLHGLLGGWAGAGLSIASGSLLLVGMFPFYVIGWLGAGDVKLIAAVGAIAGSFSAAAVALALIVTTGAAMAIIVLAWHHSLKDFLLRARDSFNLSAISMRPVYLEPRQSREVRELPYAIAIAGGSLSAMALQALGLI